MLTRKVLALLALLLAAACAPFEPDLTVRPGEHVILDRLVVETGATWPYGGVRGSHAMWADSTTARSFYNLVFFVGIEPGERLMGDIMPEAPRFFPELTPEELGRAILDVYAAGGGAVGAGTEAVLVEAGEATFAGRPGFRFAYRYRQGASVWQGLYAGAVVDERLYMIGFRGAGAAFEAMLPSAAAVIASARLVDRTAALPSARR